jgi:hypothetical protein
MLCILKVSIQSNNQFWQYSLSNVYHLWQPDELHQLLLGFGKDLLHWLLNYQEARNVKYQYDNRFTSVPQYLGLQHFSKPFNLFKSGTWEGKEIGVMIRTLPVKWAPIVVRCKDDSKTGVETDSNKMVMGAVQTLCEFSLLVSKQNHFDLSLTALHDALKQFSRQWESFRNRKC